MEENAECMLVIIGATPEGKKELIGFQVGLRESSQSPLSHMQACVAGQRDMNCWLTSRRVACPSPPRLRSAPLIAASSDCRAVDGAMGFWNALDKAFPSTKHQRLLSGMHAYPDWQRLGA